MGFSLNIVHISTAWSWKHARHPAEEREGNFRQWKQHEGREGTWMHRHMGGLQGKWKARHSWAKPGTAQDMQLEAMVNKPQRPSMGGGTRPAPLLLSQQLAPVGHHDPNRSYEGLKTLKKVQSTVCAASGAV